MFRIVACVIALLLHGQVISAQQLPLQAGERIRINSWSLGFRKLDATFQTMDGDKLRVLTAANGVALGIPLDSVNLIEVRRGKRSLWEDGALLGIVVFGVGTGALVSARYEEPEPCTGGFCPSWEIGKGGAFAYGFVLGAMLGAPVGGLVGKLVEVDRWEEVPLDRVRVSFAPRREGFALGLSVSF